MNRRSFFLTLTGTATTLALAGCASSAPGSGTDEESTDDTEPTNTPEAAVEQFYAALSAGDQEARAEVIHSEHPDEEEILQFADGEIEEFADVAEFTVRDVSVVEQDDEMAIVDVTVQLDLEGETGVHTSGLELQLEENTWKIIDETTIDRTGEISAETPELPEDVVVQYFQAIDVTDVERMEALVHTESPLIQDGFFDEDRNARIDATVELAVLVEEDDEQALVDTILTTAVDGESRAIQEDRIELRTEDGNWRIWNWSE